MVHRSCCVIRGKASLNLPFPESKTLVAPSEWKHISHLRKVQTLRIITLVDLQLDAQNSYLFIYNTFIKILYMFRALPCSSSGGLRRNCTHAASGIVTL